MTLNDIRRWLRPFLHWRSKKAQARTPKPRDVLAAGIPEFAAASKQEAEALSRGWTQGVSRARAEMQRAVLVDLARGKPRVRVKARRAA